MISPDSLGNILHQPTPTGLWHLRGDLLAEGYNPDAPTLRLLTHAFHFFTELAAKATAREYSHFASLLDIGAVGVVVTSGVSKAMKAGDNVLGTLIAAAVSEGFMVMAARQYVQAWEEEMHGTYQRAAWDLYQELWLLSAKTQPDVPVAERRRLLDELFAAVRNDEAPGTARALIIGRLYQILILVHFHNEAL